MAQKRLPGMQDEKIQKLEDAADAYMDQRDKRLSYLKKEVERRTEIVAIMKEQKKRTYICGEYVIKIRVEAEKLSVRKRKPKKVKISE
jgi:hypothetical protein